MKPLNNSLIVFPKKWQLLPYLLVGLILFVANSSLNLNYFAKGYLTILEMQTAIVVLYFLIAKLKKNNKHK